VEEDLRLEQRSRIAELRVEGLADEAPADQLVGPGSVPAAMLGAEQLSPPRPLPMAPPSLAAQAATKPTAAPAGSRQQVYTDGRLLPLLGPQGGHRRGEHL
jgi:hypothetical protein